MWTLAAAAAAVATSTIQSVWVRLTGEFHGKGTTGGGEALFDSGLLSDADRSAHRLFGVSVESDTALSASNSASGVGVKLTYGNNPGAAVPDGTSVKINEASNLPILKG